MAFDSLRRGLSREQVSTDVRIAPIVVEGWKAATRAVFRFSVAYLTLYAASTQILGGLLVFPGFSFPALGTLWPMRDVTLWWADRLGVESPLTTAGNSGDTAFYWVQTLWLLLLAIVIAVIWGELDRRREYATLNRWFRLFVRFALAAQLFYYGMAKALKDHSGKKSDTARLRR